MADEEQQQQEIQAYQPPLDMQVGYWQQTCANQSVQISDLQMKLQFANQIIASLQRQIEESKAAKSADSTGEVGQLSMLD